MNTKIGPFIMITVRSFKKLSGSFFFPQFCLIIALFWTSLNNHGKKSRLSLCIGKQAGVGRVKQKAPVEMYTGAYYFLFYSKGCVILDGVQGNE